MGGAGDGTIGAWRAIGDNCRRRHSALAYRGLIAQEEPMVVLHDHAASRYGVRANGSPADSVQ